LEAFAEPDPLGQEGGIIELSLGENMSPAHLGPELAHATRHGIGVGVQVFIATQGNDVLGRGAHESPQIQLLPTGNGN